MRNRQKRALVEFLVSPKKRQVTFNVAFDMQILSKCNPAQLVHNAPVLAGTLGSSLSFSIVGRNFNRMLQLVPVTDI